MYDTMRNLWQQFNDARHTVADLPNKAAHAVMDKENELEHSVLQKGVDFAQDQGVISADTGKSIMQTHEVVEGMKSSALDVAGGTMKAFTDPSGAAADISKGMTGLKDGENALEHKAVQAGVDFAQQQGIISENTGKGIVHAEEVFQGVKDGMVEMSNNSMKMFMDPSGAGQDMVKGMGKAYQDGGG